MALPGHVSPESAIPYLTQTAKVRGVTHNRLLPAFLKSRMGPADKTPVAETR